MGVHEELADQAALHVLGLLTGAHKSAFEGHLSVCAECTAEVVGFAPVVEALAEATSTARPESKVRRALLAGLNAESSV